MSGLFSFFSLSSLLSPLSSFLSWEPVPRLWLGGGGGREGSSTPHISAFFSAGEEFFFYIYMVEPLLEILSLFVQRCLTVIIKMLGKKNEKRKLFSLLVFFFLLPASFLPLQVYCLA